MKKNHFHFLGSCEIASCLYKYLEIKKSEGYKVVNLFADRCGGQNCNQMILCMLNEVLHNFKFDSITLNFLVSGHSQNENDNAHSTIESGCRNRTIYTTNQLEILIQMAFKKNVCKVIRVFHEDIINYKSFVAFPQYLSVLKDTVVEECEKKGGKGKKAEKGKKVYWSKLMIISFTKERPNEMLFKYKYSEEEYHHIEFRSLVSSRQKKKTKKDVFRKYKECVGVPGKKKEDLMELCQKKLIPAQHHSFFRDLKVKK